MAAPPASYRIQAGAGDPPDLGAAPAMGLGGGFCALAPTVAVVDEFAGFSGQLGVGWVIWKAADPQAKGILEAEPESWLVDLASRIPDASAEHLKALLALKEDVGAVSLVALADAVGAEKKVIDGWNRNLGRSIKAVVRDHRFLRLDQKDGTRSSFSTSSGTMMRTAGCT